MNGENANIHLGPLGTLPYKKQYYLRKVTFKVLHGLFAPFLSIEIKSQ